MANIFRIHLFKLSILAYFSYSHGMIVSPSAYQQEFNLGFQTGLKVRNGQIGQGLMSFGQMSAAQTVGGITAIIDAFTNRPQNPNGACSIFNGQPQQFNACTTAYGITYPPAKQIADGKIAQGSKNTLAAALGAALGYYFGFLTGLLIGSS